MYEYQLFLGFVANEAFYQGIDKLPNAALYSIFINNSDYLHEASCDGEVIIGKYLEKKAPLHELYMLESNIQSIVSSKLIPDFNFKKNPLRLFSLSS